jgi:type IV pilus assembly protein PilN
MPRINLLPWRLEERQRRAKQFYFAVAGAVLGGVAVALMGSLVVTSLTNSERERNAYLKTEIAALDRQITEILGLETQRSRLLGRMEIIERLQRSRPEIVHVFDELVRTLPEGIYLTSVRQTGRKLELKGLAQSSTRVSTFMRNIEASAWLSNPELQLVETKGISAVATGGAEFVLTVQQKGPDPEAEIRALTPGAKGRLHRAVAGNGGAP